MTSFHCFNDSKCEWLNGLDAFASQFNKVFGTEYTLSECLDISGDTTRKQPEVRLESLGKPSMVIERKKIVYPLDYFKKHRAIHQFWSAFGESFRSLSKSLFQSDYFELSIGHDSLCSLNARQLKSLASSITESITKELSRLDELGVVSSDEPIPWSFYRAAMPDSDLIVDAKLSLIFPLDITIPSDSDLIKAKMDISGQLEEHLSDTCKKLEGYDGCLSILILEMCGDFLCLPSYGDFNRMINDSAIPQSISQVWLAIPQDDSGQSIAYHQVYTCGVHP
jgi:hypothetical protein